MKNALNLLVKEIITELWSGSEVIFRALTDHFLEDSENLLHRVRGYSDAGLVVFFFFALALAGLYPLANVHHAKWSNGDLALV